MRRRVRVSLGPALAAAVISAAAVVSRVEAQPLPTVPKDVVAFSRSLTTYFEKLQNFVAREEMAQLIFNQANGTLSRKRTLISDFQIAPLEEDPAVLWEFRFVRSIDGIPLDETGRQMADFFRLRHTSAREERLSLFRMAVTKSLPGCYWHNLGLILKAFEEPSLPNFSFRQRSSGVEFQQVQGLGIPDDFFDPRSARHYPKGVLTFSEPDGALSALDLEFPSEDSRVRMRLNFSKPEPPDGIPLPKEFVVDRLRLSTGLPLTRTTFVYSDFKRFTVTTEDSPGPVSH